MTRKLLASVGTVVVAAGSFLALGTTSALAGAGCTADNASTTTTVTGSVTYPPGTVEADSTSIHCQYTSAGGTVLWNCKLIAGECRISVIGDSAKNVRCITVNGGCAGAIVVPAGTVIDVQVKGGSASAADMA